MRSYPDVEFVFPVHPNPAVRGAVDRWLVPAGFPNLVLCRPLDYLPFVAMMIQATVVLTDSGGVQEEAPSLGKPVVVMRDVTERTEGTASGLVHLVGPHRDRIVTAVTGLLDGAPATGGRRVLRRRKRLRAHPRRAGGFRGARVKILAISYYAPPCGRRRRSRSDASSTTWMPGSRGART